MKYSFIDPNQIRPKGWLRDQLVIQANGLSGNLDKIWPDVRDSAWIGGDREGWERVPYWLDGFIPLAYLLEDEDMIARADRYVNAIIDRQQEDGWICPCSMEKRASYDLWAVFLIGKVLALYCDFTKSERAEKALYRAMKNLYHTLDDVTLDVWGKSRWFECIIPLKYLHDRYNEDWLIELAVTLRKQGTNYDDFTAKWEKPLDKWTFETHIVNMGMMLKAEALYCEMTGEPMSAIPEKHWHLLDKFNGTVVGTFTGDECLSGRNNNRGTELCGVVELMYSCEWLLALTGKSIWGDRLEKAAFNALPATISDDMWTHQYDQQVNQIACIRFPGKSFFASNNSEAHLFGLEPNYGCCTANFNQAWPKLAMSAFMKSEKGIVSSIMLPSQLETNIGQANVKITVETEYPFKLAAKYIVETDREISFELKIRIPKWAKSVVINGENVSAKGFYSIYVVSNGKNVYEVEFIDDIHFVNRPFGLKAVEYGPLVYSLPIETEYKMIEYTRRDVERKFPYCDYELIPKSEWRYGFAGNDFELCNFEGDGIPFSSKSPKIKIKTSMCRVDWDYAERYENVANHRPKSNKAIKDSETMELIPYGCAKLRMTEMPMVK